MNKLKQSLLALSTSIAISGCGGSQSDTPLDYDIPLKTPSTVSDYPLTNIYFDTYEIPIALNSLHFRESRRYGQQWATGFSYARNMSINHLSWLGLVENNHSLLDGNARFILRVFYDEYQHPASIPASPVAAEYLVEAEARLLGALETGYVYEFVYRDYETFRLNAGNYWISIVDPGTEGMNFSWALTTEIQSSYFYSSSTRTTDQGDWKIMEVDKDVEAMAVRLEGGRLLTEQ